VGEIAFDRGAIAGTISKLLSEAAVSIASDFGAAKTFIDQASTLLDLHLRRRPEVAAAGASRPHGLARWQIDRLISLVTHRLDSKLRNSDMASSIGLSPSHFLKAFRQSFDVTPQAYVARRRIEHAQLLMLTTEEPLAQVALACGFADQAQFSKAFRREAGVPPLQWRRARGRDAATIAWRINDGRVSARPSSVSGRHSSAVELVDGSPHYL